MTNTNCTNHIIKKEDGTYFKLNISEILINKKRLILIYLVW